MKSKNIFFIIFLLFFSHFVFAQNIEFSSDFPSLEPLFIEEKVSSALSPLEIIENGLRFSECAENSEEWNFCIQKFLDLETLVHEETKNISEKDKAEKILTLIYESLLIQYREQQTKINVMFKNGTYNCVSSGLIYLALAKSSGINVVGVKTPSHAFCSVFISGINGSERIDVETTNPFGFNPGQTRLLEKTKNSAKYAVIPKKYYSNRRDISVKTFISLVGANMTSFYVSKKDYKNAVPFGATVMIFRNGENSWETSDGREIFDVPTLNFSVELENQKKYVDSISWLDKVILRYGIDEKTRSGLNTSVHNAIADFSNKQDFSSAEQIYETHKNLISENFNFQAQKMIFLSKVQSNLDNLSDKDALNYVQEQYKNNLASEKSIKLTLDKWQEYYWINLINAETSHKNYANATKIANEALKAMPNNANITRAKNQAIYNHDAEFHNLMATYANKRQYEKALEVLNKGLSENPTSQTLQNDKRRLEQMMKK